MVRFVSEFGAQSVPDTAPYVDAEAWPDIDWDLLEQHHGLQRALMERYVPPAEHTTFDSWRAATQRYQASLLRHQIETLRRLKYRPSGGFCLASLADAAPLVSTSILDHERVPKLAFAAVTDACRRVIVVADRMDDQLSPGDAVALDVHVVSDAHVALSDVVLSASLRWANGSQDWRWTGDVPADDCVRVGIVRFVVPDAPGSIRLDLVLEHGDEVATNRYDAVISR